MDKLSRFPTAVPEVRLTSEGNKSLDDLVDRLDAVVSGQENVLRQLQATHTGHEQELWGKDFEIGEDPDIEEANNGTPEEE